MLRASLRVALLATVLGVAACGRSPTAPRTSPVPPGFDSAPSVVAIGSVQVRIEAYLWRDFMPISPPDGRPLALVIRLRTVSGKALPAGLAVDSAWVLFQRESWASAPRSTGADYGPDVLEIYSEGGPRWGPGVKADVVARLTGVAEGPKLVAARQVPIQRTE